jgi:hypothetical protein
MECGHIPLHALAISLSCPFSLQPLLDSSIEMANNDFNHDGGVAKKAAGSKVSNHAYATIPLVLLFVLQVAGRHVH